jgi:hypothetical protein
MYSHASMDKHNNYNNHGPINLHITCMHAQYVLYASLTQRGWPCHLFCPLVLVYTTMLIAHAGWVVKSPIAVKSPC